MIKAARGSGALLAAAVAALATSCTTSVDGAGRGVPTITAPRPVPSARATPEAVAKTYLDAAKAGDCDLTRRLTLRHTWAWCGDPTLLAFKSILAPEAIGARYAGRDEQCINFDMKTSGSSDGTIRKGWEPWGLCLVHTTAGWRVYDQGQG